MVQYVLLLSEGCYRRGLGNCKLGLGIAFCSVPHSGTADVAAESPVEAEESLVVL